MGDSIQQQLDRLLSLFLEEQAANRAHREEVYAKIEATGQAFATSHQADSHVCRRTDKGIAMCTAEDPMEDPHFNKWRPDVEAKKFPEDVERVQLGGEKAMQIRELTSLIQKRFTNPENSVDLYVERVNYSVIAQAESLRYTLGGLGVRRVCYDVLRFVMENGAKGCENTVSGNLRAQRAKSMKFMVWDRRKSRLHFMNGS